MRSDFTVAKNYLLENEIRRLGRAVTGYFDYIEDLIERENTFTMQQAEREYDEFNKTQKNVSDFDKEIKRLQQLVEIPC